MLDLAPVDVALGGVPAETEEEGFPIPGDCWDALVLFLCCDRAWRVHYIAHPGGLLIVWQGLDWPAVRAIRQERDIRHTKDLFDQVRALETGALEILNRH